MRTLEQQKALNYYYAHKEEFARRHKEWVLKNRGKNTETKRQYRKTKNGKAAVLKAVIKYQSTHPKRRYAWLKARQNIPLEPCIQCGKFPSHRHHPDINKPLEIIFLCPLHHKRIHMV